MTSVYKKPQVRSLNSGSSLHSRILVLIIKCPFCWLNLVAFASKWNKMFSKIFQSRQSSSPSRLKLLSTFLSWKIETCSFFESSYLSKIIKNLATKSESLGFLENSSFELNSLKHSALLTGAKLSSCFFCWHRSTVNDDLECKNMDFPAAQIETKDFKVWSLSLLLYWSLSFVPCLYFCSKK